MHGKRLTKEEFIERARAVHGDKYIYDDVIYLKWKSPVEIICPKHGKFFMDPYHHCHRKQGCRECAREASRKIVCGVGINDASEAVFDTDAYQVWTNMLKRCYKTSVQERRSCYKGCSVCEEWHHLSNFIAWYEQNCKKGYQIDKDILVKGNKLYSPETCLGVPRRINALFISARAVRGSCPIGVTYRHKKYIAQINYGHGSEKIGQFDTPEEAFFAYKSAKESYIKQLAAEYYEKGDITKRTYDALMRYEVEITD